jgi:hypothetical protein
MLVKQDVDMPRNFPDNQQSDVQFRDEEEDKVVSQFKMH